MRVPWHRARLHERRTGHCYFHDRFHIVIIIKGRRKRDHFKKIFSNTYL